ncbi:MAG TPA: DUF4129 domain-containing protein [Streptosporangiaceae bacterium]|nr:DUF4129 domain-containing protein [Streptosporangiaceae bacterium]
MPDRLPTRAALAALLLLLTIAGIRAAGVAVGLHLPKRPVVIGIGAAVEAALAGLLIALRWGRRTPAGVGARLLPLLHGTLVTGLIAVPLALLVASIGKIHRRRPTPPTPPARLHPGKLRLARTAHSTLDLAAIEYVLVGLLIAAIIVAAILIWRRRRRLARLSGRDVPLDEETGTPAELARAVDSGRLALRELDDARAAIIGCYLAMEESLAEAGAARGAAETPDELLARAVDGGLVHGAPAAQLTALFYEARFSTHPMPAARRDEAEQALADLAATLSDPAGTAAPAGTAGTAGPAEPAGISEALE